MILSFIPIAKQVDRGRFDGLPEAERLILVRDMAKRSLVQWIWSALIYLLSGLLACLLTNAVDRLSGLSESLVAWLAFTAIMLEWLERAARTRAEHALRRRYPSLAPNA
jgi:hypothetical protein